MPVSVQGTLLVGRYRVLRHLGAGSMATVLLCHDERLDRLVAVKRLHADQPEDVRRRFLREAKLGASLNHPNLVSVFDTVTDDEAVLIVMEYVKGAALSAALRRGPLGPERVGRMAAELGDALDHAHRHGVVHRDVKPANVLLRDNGTTKLADLGIATAAHHTRITRSGVVLGTASYMAPEQLEGEEVGPPADIYALAAVCFEALTGERARQGRTPMEIARRIATEPVIDVRERWPDAPVAVAELLRRGMAEDPRERPTTAGELGVGLRRALAERPSPTAVTRHLERGGGAATGRSDRAAGAKAAPGRFERRAAAATGPPGRFERRAAPTARPGRFERRGAAHRGPRSRLVALGIIAALVALAVATVVLAVGSGGGEDPSPSRGAGARDERQAGGKEKQKQRRREQRAQSASPAPQAQEATPPADEPTPAPAPEEQPAQEQPAPEQPAGVDPAEGARLNEQGFQLMSEGRYEEAIPILQRAVDSFPAGTTDLNYAYALFNLGQALRLAGRPDEAVPILERRLQIPNQTGIVRRELALAREAASRE
ncbi:MAG TPA: protein kinase [Thermoleophilaceae bacterium]|nr:protein kinase [Thermoleophilaceae bacterium]